MNLGMFWPKIVPALAVVIVFAAVSSVRPQRALLPVAFILAALVARDLLASLFPIPTLPLLADLGILTLYVVWLRGYTGWKAPDWIYLVLNCLVAAAAVVGIFFPYLPQAEFMLGTWLLANVAYFAVAAGLVSALDTEKADIVLVSRFSVIAALFIYYLVTLLYGYENSIVQLIVAPASYLLPLGVLIASNAILHREGSQTAHFFSSNLEATYNFMENLGNAITAKIDLGNVLELIISAAVRNISADAGAILMVDEYEDILHVRATYGIYPPLGPVPEIVRVTPASLKRYFAETPIPIGETVLGETVRNGRPILIRDIRLDDRMAGNRADDILFISSLAAIPLVVRGRVLGVLSVLKRSENQFFEEVDFQHMETLAEYASITIDNLYTYSEVLEKREIEREVDIAAQIQQKLLPAGLPDVSTADIAVYNKPAKGVSGDYYDVFRLEQDKLGIAICDVAGKGIPAALVMVMIRSILHLIVSPARDAAATLTWVNRGISGRIDLDHFATIAYLIYDRKTREIQYSNAAHLPLMVYRQRTGTSFKVDTEGLPIGVEKDTRYEQKSFLLEEGDLVLMYTDGILEAMNTAGRQYGLGGLKKMVEKNAALPAAELVASISEDLRRFVGTERQHDDQTLLIMKAL
jgi:sigma-B regulation protein RsbU (phosphoserine phosphatase)